MAIGNNITFIRIYTDVLLHSLLDTCNNKENTSFYNTMINTLEQFNKAADIFMISSGYTVSERAKTKTVIQKYFDDQVNLNTNLSKVFCNV